LWGPWRGNCLPVQQYCTACARIFRERLHGPGRPGCAVEVFQMSEYLVNCITKPNRESRHEHITHIGNTNAGWQLSREAAISRIETKQDAFYTIDLTTNRKVYIGVVREGGLKLPYLRTHADGKWNDNLLAQRECDGTCKLVA
jgi:hypothetical protein